MKTKEEIEQKIKELEEKYEAACEADDRHTQYIVNAVIGILKWTLNQE